ncbi:hypothetical protein [Methylobacterium sp. 88A]|uniref:hypothetical protein n=1 Tax=Methylobacterium sp. 88A TaxID=1131813 RepID=UPI0003A1F1F7|nr:hypothetical protein [Methylobacterium sp. 88A]
MPRRLKPSPLPGAREPLADLALRGWIHTGTIPLDGVLMDRSRVGPNWRDRVSPWLDHAAEARALGDLVLVLFARPLWRDCAVLGPCLPVVRRFGLLATAPFAEPEPALAEVLRDHLVHVAAGRLSAVPLSDSTGLDVAGWWMLDGIRVVPAERVPTLRQVASTPRLASAPTLTTGAEPFAPMREALARRPRRRLQHTIGDLVAGARRWVGGTFGFLWEAYIILLVLTVAGGLVMGFIESIRTTAEANWGKILQPLVVTFVVTFVVAWLVSHRAGKGSPTAWVQTVRSGAPAAGTLRDPFWRKAAAWLAWRSPYAGHLRRLYARRLTEVERLFAAGRIEEALHRAVGLAPPANPATTFADLPLTGPGLRESISLDLKPQRASRLGLDPAVEERLRLLYGEQATALRETGDIERAAFVLDQLAGNPHAAVQLLAETGQIETAARLAEARRLGPGIAIPLWFRAGQAKRALALAARHDAHEELWKELPPGDPFRPVLAEAWAERLAGIGAFDHAAALAFGVPALTGRREAWIRQALADGGRPAPESLARALRALPWDAQSVDPLYAAFAELLVAPGLEGAARRLALAAHWLDPAFEGGPPQPPNPAFSLLCRGLTRRLAVDDGALGHDPERARLAGRLAEAGGQVALRQHLRRLQTRPPHLGQSASGPITIPDGPALAEITDTALLAGGRLLVGYRSGLVRLLGRSGRERWRGQVDGLMGFATIGAGARAFILRQTLDGPALLLLDSDAGRLTLLCPLPVTHWQAHADETGWLVFDGEGLVCLDTASLLACGGAGGDAWVPTSGPAHHWRLPMTEPGRPLALASFPDGWFLVHARHDGLIEWWSLARKTLAVSCRFWTPPPCADGDVLGLTEGVAWALQNADTQRVLRAYPHTWTPATRDAEQRLMEAMARAEPRPVPRLATMEGGHLWAATDIAAGAVWADVVGGKGKSGPTVRWHGSRSLRTRFALDGTAAAVFDERGRLVVLDPRTGQIALRLL